MSAPGELVATGLLMGLVYVLTGPDHLAGMAAIVVGAPSRQTGDGAYDQAQTTKGDNHSAFQLGLRWGLGHSLALVVTGSALVAFAGAFSSDYVVMDERLSLILGMYGADSKHLDPVGFRARVCGLPPAAERLDAVSCRESRLQKLYLDPDARTTKQA